MRTIKLYDNNGGNRLDTVLGSTSTFFTGVDDLFNQNFDPIIVGRSFIYWLKLPSWFEKDEDLRYFKEMTQKNFLSFSGLSNIELETASVQSSGFTGAEYDVVSSINKSNNSFSLTHKEYSGSVMRKLYQKWIFYVRDPRLNIALYPNKFGVEYGSRNHTGQLLYVTVRPDALNVSGTESIVEFAALYTNVMPKTVNIDNYTFTAGESESFNIDVEFTGFVEVGPGVEEFAAKILKEKILDVSENGNGIPFIDTMGVNAPAINLANEGTLYSEIFKADE